MLKDNKHQKRQTRRSSAFDILNLLGEGPRNQKH